MDAQRSAQLVEAGLWLQMSGDVEGARRLFRQALKLDPTNLHARQALDATLASPEPESEGATPEAPIDPSEEAQGIAPSADAAESDGSELQSDWYDAHPEWPRQSDSGERTDAPPLQPMPFAPEATSAWDSNSNPGVHLNAIKPGVGDVMDMIADEGSPVASTAPVNGDVVGDVVREEIQTLIRGARDLIELDDHTGAMDLILKAQALAPEDPEVLFLRDRSEQVLQTMFESKLGSMTARPRVVLKQDEIIWLNLDHRAGFVLAQIDGTVTFEDLFEVCGMSRLDTARILAQLKDEGVIAA